MPGGKLKYLYNVFLISFFLFAELQRTHRDETLIKTLTQKLVKVHTMLVTQFFEMLLPRNFSLYVN